MIKRKDGRWMERITINGQRKSFYGRTKQEVLQKIRAYKERPVTPKTMGQLIDEWLKSYKKTVKESSAYVMESRFRIIRGQWGETPIRDINTADVERFLSTCAAKYSAGTMRIIKSAVKRIFSYGVKTGDIERDPAMYAESPKGRQREKRKPPTDAEIEIIKQYGNECDMGLFAIIALYTGLRRGELLALHWDDIHPDERYITVDKAVSYSGNQPVISTTKTESSMGRVPILDALLPYISHARQMHGIIFHDLDGYYMPKGQFQYKWENFQKLTGTRITPHQLRHAFATMLFNADVPPEKMQILLRHATLAMTMDLYREIQAKKVDQIFNEVKNVDY